MHLRRRRDRGHALLRRQVHLPDSRPPGHRHSGDRLPDPAGGAPPVQALRRSARPVRNLDRGPLLDTGSPQSWNAYDYADDTPVTTPDPSGSCAEADCDTPNCPNRTPTDTNPHAPALTDYAGSGSTVNNTKAYGKQYKAEISTSASDTRVQERALERQKATADAAVAAAKKQASGFKHRLLSLVADVIGLTDAYNCFTKGDVMGCINTALTAVPWGKIFKAVKVGVEAFKVWRSLDRAYTAVKDAEEAAKVAEDAVASERLFAEAGKAESAGADAAEDAAGCVAHSFIPGTAVRLANGSSRPISKVKVGDTVLATDPQTGVTAPEKVQRVIVTRTDKDFTTLALDTVPVRGPPHKTHSDESTSHTLTTTWHHPFWDATRHRWTDAHDLTAGTKLRTETGTTVTVTKVHNFHQHQTTYDLTVGDLHTYYVLAGATPVLVHNCGEGTATVYLDPVEKHATVKVETADEALHTEQVGVPGTDAVPAIRTEPHAPTTIRVRIPLPNPGGALAFQEVTLGRNLGRYNVDSRSCVTYRAEVLRAGGVTDLPDMSSSIELTKYLIRRHNAG